MFKFVKALGAIFAIIFGLLGLIVGLGLVFDSSDQVEARRETRRVDETQRTVAPVQTPQSNDLDAEQKAAMDRKVDQIMLTVRSCVRSNIRNAYQAGVHGLDQVIRFMATKCFGPFASAHRQMGIDEETSTVFFRALVLQEVAPDEWQRAVRR